MYGQLADIGLSTFRKITDLWSGAKADSLIDYTRVARVEPIALIDNDCLYLDSLPEVMQSLQSIFAGYYLQAIAISTNVGKVEVTRHLDKLNPNRKPLDSAADSAGWLLAAESYTHRLPTPTDVRISLEGLTEMLNGGKVRDDKENEKREFATQLERDTTRELKELSNLSVGKMLSVEITDGLHKASIPVSIRLMASSIPSQNLVHILSVGNEDKSVKERYHAWRAGRLEFIRDLVFCQDLIDAHRKNLMADKDGVYSNLIQRHRGNQLSTLVSGNPSVATASNLVVISTNTAAQLELKINGKLSDFRTREKLFKETYVMIMAVIDKEWDRVRFYHRGIDTYSDVGVRDLKIANKGSGPDVSDILKAYQMGNSPSL